MQHSELKSPLSRKILSVSESIQFLSRFQRSCGHKQRQRQNISTSRIGYIMSRGPGKARETAVATMHERPLPPTLLVRIVPLESCFIKHFLERCLIFDFKYLGRNDWRRRMNKCIKVPLFSCILFRRIIISNIIVTKGHITHNTADAIMRPVTPDKHFMSKKY